LEVFVITITYLQDAIDALHQSLKRSSGRPRASTVWKTMITGLFQPFIKRRKSFPPDACKIQTHAALR